MTNTARCEKSEIGEHCWHPYSMIATNPPIPVVRCCWCGAERELNRLATGFNHGPHGGFGYSSVWDSSWPDSPGTIETRVALEKA